MKIEQLEMEVGTNVAEGYNYKHKAVSEWTIVDFERFDTYIRARITKQDKGLIDSIKTIPKHAKKGDPACLSFVERALNQAEQVSSLYEDDKRVALDRLIEEIGTPIYKKFLNAERVRKNQRKNRPVNLKTTYLATLYTERAEKTAKELDLDIPKGELIAVLLKLGASALEEHVKQCRDLDLPINPHNPQ